MGNKSLTPGKVYYLNDSTEQDHNHPEGHVFRNGTSREPAVVSKPVYIATSPTTAVVTNFRGLMGGQRDFVVDEILKHNNFTNEYFFLRSAWALYVNTRLHNLYWALRVNTFLFVFLVVLCRLYTPWSIDRLKHVTISQHQIHFRIHHLVCCPYTTL